jgi:hypothetical protein
MTVHKKKEIKQSPVSDGAQEAKEVIPEVKPKEEPAVASVENKPEEVKTESVVPEDVAQVSVEAAETVVPPEVKTETPPSTPTSDLPSQQANPLSDFKEKVEEEMNMPVKPQKNYMWPILFIFIIAAVLLAGVFAYKQGMFKGAGEKTKVVSVSPAPTSAVTPSPVKTVDLTKYEVEILNGSEVDGEASRQKTNLEGEGFTISSIGNADNTDHTDTIIEAKAEVSKDFIAKLKSVLDSTFTVGETQSLSEDSSVPVVVILGTKK